MLPPSVRAELDQTPEWWDGVYRALERRLIPRDLASHDGHDLLHIGKYTSVRPQVMCTQCGIDIDPYAEGDADG